MFTVEESSLHALFHLTLIAPLSHLHFTDEEIKV